MPPKNNILGLTPEVLPPSLPVEFNPAALQRDLEVVESSASLLQQYIAAVKAKYRTKAQLDLIDLMVLVLGKKTQLTRAQSELAKAEADHADFTRLQQRQRDLQDAEHAAQLAEANLRTARAEFEIKKLHDPAHSATAVPLTADEIKMAEVQARERLTRQFTSQLKLGKVLDLAELQKAYTATLSQIQADASLTEVQRLEAVEFLDQEYEKQKASLTKGTTIYGDE
jgi:hypothetical protein